MLGPISEQKIKVWAIMENILKQGKCRAIGVCDFSIIDLYELLIYLFVFLRQMEVVVLR